MSEDEINKLKALLIDLCDIIKIAEETSFDWQHSLNCPIHLRKNFDNLKGLPCGCGLHQFNEKLNSLGV